MKGKRFNGDKIEVLAVDGVRYTVPQYINPENVEDSIDVRFRVGAVFKDSFIAVYFDDVREMHIKKRILTPGEMEKVKLTRVLLDKYPHCKRITIKVEGE